MRTTLIITIAAFILSACSRTSTPPKQGPGICAKQPDSQKCQDGTIQK